MKKTFFIVLLVSAGISFAQENDLGTAFNSFGAFFTGYLPTNPQVLNLPFGDPVQALDAYGTGESTSPVMIQVADGGDPDWLTRTQSYGETTYEKDNGIGVSSWLYEMGISPTAASEQRARDRAGLNIQARTAENIASNFVGRMDMTEFSLTLDSEAVDVETRIQGHITNSVKTKIPRYEPLEWFVRKEAVGGKTSYTAYVLVRFQRVDIIKAIENVDAEKIVEAVIKQLGSAVTAEGKSHIVVAVQTAQSETVADIRLGGASY
ncbi:MAG: hypothetical protein LBU17_12445 [Treponema sp.]|nr:hypothetical protein [Treponema sp.]